MSLPRQRIDLLALYDPSTPGSILGFDPDPKPGIPGSLVILVNFPTNDLYNSADEAK